ncbi:MAG TPA: hypothetical protein VFA69_05795 [Candidatus Nitrosotalea sp.]|nr:hypothetical protein [Candidatus Nitrosotalea sp.]
MDYKNGKPSGKAPTIKVIIGNGVTVEKAGESKLPKYPSNLYREIEP